MKLTFKKLRIDVSSERITLGKVVNFKEIPPIPI